ncbi:unnamed protein product [Cylindrotheca closterium]|uniref:Uncharacterized protein n=1 Tax=Cylindrotheca closterium TaxID=2856 RepID=A0AAD2JNM8_9STRA|nr:unnamed protein product [Cylindrotheca closterium]
MRFLLNSKAHRTGKEILKSTITKTRGKQQLDAASTKASSAGVSALHEKSWGQQCSPTCGCVVRFEAKIDPVSKTIVDIHYHAKRVVAMTSKDKSKLEPVLTTRTGKPMFRECNCETVHQLAAEITSFLPNRRLEKVQNMTDFAKTRSSTAFRHAVLAEQNLPRESTHCFDVVEEAFTAMISGNMPTQRRNQGTFAQSLTQELLHNNNKVAGMGRTRLSLSSPGSMSTLKMFDIEDDYWESELSQSYFEKDNHEEPPRSKFDWVSYVDENYQDEDYSA